MPTYHYACKSCEHEEMIVQSIKSEPETICVSCGEAALERVIHAPDLLIRGEPKTLGQLADRNTSKMGKYELEAKRENHRKEGAKGRKELPKAERPWWRKSDKVDTRLAKLAPNVEVKNKKIIKSEPLRKKARDYIMTGKK